uniref:Uncharacterized protein n=1 Tax=Knipowitschia caucasica TaxID=637954 RepID=A0AAV2JFL8_KNICA
MDPRGSGPGSKPRPGPGPGPGPAPSSQSLKSDRSNSPPPEFREDGPEDQRRENKEQFDNIREDINGIAKRLDEAEERIMEAETSIQASEEMLLELAKLQTQVEAKEKNIRFQTPFPARLRVHYSEGMVTYNSAQEATEDMVKRGHTTLLEQIKRRMWQWNGKQGNTGAWPRCQVSEKLQAFRRQSDDTA